MKILTWNCNGAFRKKYKSLELFNSDIMIIQECENPEESSDIDYKTFAQNSLWIGNNKNKGLGIFAKDDILIVNNNWPTEELKYFISCRINESFNLLGTWCHGANSPTFGYIGQFWKYLQLNKSKMQNIIIAGDFNSNSIWDKWDRWWNHTDVVRELSENGIKSFYHELNNIEQGKEVKPTFFLQKNKEKPYHIDYFFGSAEILKKIISLKIENYKDWINISDHMPILIEIKDNDK